MWKNMTSAPPPKMTVDYLILYNCINIVLGVLFKKPLGITGFYSIYQKYN